MSESKPTGRVDPDRAEPQGKTVPNQGETDIQHDRPRAPHEHDESSDSQAAAEPSQRAIGRQAQQDVERGVADTTKGEALDEAYEKTRKTSDQPEKGFSPGGRGASRR